MDVREKLVDIVCDATKINGCIHSCNHPPCAMVRGIVDALIENGVTVQPVKVGDYVYYIEGGYYKEPKYCEVSRPCKVVEVTSKLQRNSGTVMHGFITDNGTRYSFNGIGKTVFLSHEEAVNALEKRKKICHSRRKENDYAKECGLQKMQ